MAPIPFPDPRLASDGILLREPRHEDRDALVEAIADPEIPRWTPIQHPYGIEQADAWLEESERRRQAGEQLNLLVVDAADRVLGSVMAIYEQPGSDAAELGYWVAAPARGRGVASRAIGMLRDWVAAELGTRRIELLIHVDNAASRRAGEKAGFTFTGEVREPPRRCEPTGERSHAVYAWEAPGE